MALVIIHIIRELQFLKKLKLCKNRAEKQSVHFWISMINSLGFLYLISFKISFLVWSNMTTEIHPVLVELSVHLPLILFGLLTLFTLPWIVDGMIILSAYAQKQVFKAIQKIDMWTWRKYRKNYLSESIWKLQNNTNKIDSKTKRIVAVTVAATYAAYLGVTWP